MYFRVHFKVSSNVHPLGVEKTHKSIPNYWDNPMEHPVWTDAEVHGVQKTHVPISNISDRIAYSAVRFARWLFDTATFFKWGKLTEAKVLNRAIFLETVAAVPGMVNHFAPPAFVPLLRPRLFLRLQACSATCDRFATWTATMGGFTRCLRRQKTSECTC